MPSTTLYDNGGHRNILLEDFGYGTAVQANQHLIIHDGVGMILDPGGHKIFSEVIFETEKLLHKGRLGLIFFSHQDPDVIAAANGWLMTTDATAYISALWTRFVPHFGLDDLVAERLRPIPDGGFVLDLNGAELTVLPAHFLHSAGNFQVYDAASKILYTGDLGASLGVTYHRVTDFNAHIEYMRGFHQRYMGSNTVMRAWADMVRELDIEIIAPQHGAHFVGKAMVERFIDWCAHLQCGVDLASKTYFIPTQRA